MILFVLHIHTDTRCLLLTDMHKTHRVQKVCFITSDTLAACFMYSGTGLVNCLRLHIQSVLVAMDPLTQEHYEYPGERRGHKKVNGCSNTLPKDPNQVEVTERKLYIENTK